mmetsp:Transcript_16781/g.37626  ORF Transcript_16781/g.37626 Transcript_16781/m.37626 type:complete len:242 (-) Transcript_16781:100-825(-)
MCTLSSAEAQLSISMALRLHLDDAQQLQHTPHPVFDERLSPLDDQLFWRTPVDSHDVEEIMAVVHGLVTEFGLRGEPEVLVFTLVLVERLLRVHPNLLLPCTLRPVLLVALVLGLKIMCDESLSGAKKAIARAGLVHVDGYHLWQLEGAYLDAVAWDVNVEALPYHLYMFDLHSLLVLHRADVLETFPHLAALLAKLEQLDVDDVPHRAQTPPPEPSEASWTEHGLQRVSFSGPLPRRVID